jgi:hypothetical protein
MTAKQAFELIVNATGLLKLTRQEHMAVQEALQVIEKELPKEKKEEKKEEK